uniref:PAS domain-containing protein n=1 Tax=Coccolithus braarudii TaxID=221442 RepID=A0A7S0LQB7_9EUKA|mmetsp:Transcript_48919/g.104435  ORF Transcript_48919/g.104435 Transcript_48919/m.104435 type:complete len:566 (+) Transcript_48919:28-1725(+)
MPKSYTCWNQHRRPNVSLHSGLNASLFSDTESPSSSSFPPPALGAEPAEAGGEQKLTDDVLEGLVDALVDDNLFGLSPPIQNHMPLPADFLAMRDSSSSQLALVPDQTEMALAPAQAVQESCLCSQGACACTDMQISDLEMQVVSERESNFGSECVAVPQAASSRNECVAIPVIAHAPATAVEEETPFLWEESPFLVLKDGSGASIDPLSLVAGGLLNVSLQPPLLYWNERRRWMWHKKWCLPRVKVRLKLPISPEMLPAGHTLQVLVSAGTIRDGQVGLADEGLVGTCQLPLEGGEAVFSSLLFKHTSFNCGNRPFHLVVTLIAVGSEAAAPAQQTPGPSLSDQQKRFGLACYCSSPIHVDARKRTKGERPEASADDVRLMQRQRGNAPFATAEQQAAAHGLAHGVPGVVEAGSPAAATMQALVQAMGCTVLELRSDLVVLSVLSTTALGYQAHELVGQSMLSVLHPDEHSALMQTTQALLAMAAGGGGIGSSSAVRALHRARMRAPNGQIESVVIDSTITAIGTGPAGPHQLLVSIRYATPPVGPDSAIFRVFPANAPMYFAS